jgi:hypothetical protein
VQLALAAIVPAAIFLLLVWRTPHRRVAMLFAGLTLLYVSSYVILQGTPASLDFVLDAPPWSHRAPGYLQKNLLLNDVPLGILPWLETVRDRWASGTLPLLNRTQGSGSVLWLNPHTLALHPTTIYALLFSTFAWPLAVLVTKLLVALWGMYLFLGLHALSPHSRVFGAIAYAFSIFTIVFGVFPHTNITTLLPLLLYTLHSAAESWKGATHAAMVGALILLGGHPESIQHVFLIAAVWSIPHMVRAPVRLAAAGAVAALMAAPVLLPFVAYLPNSQRAHDAAQMLSAPPMSLEHLVPFVLPNYFGNPRVHNYRHAFNFNEIASQYAGLSAFVLAITAAVAQPRRFRWWIASFFALVLLAMQPGFVRAALEHVPFAHLTNQGRLRFAIAFVIATLGAHGLQMLLERRRLARVVAVSVGVATIAIVLLSYPLFAQYGIRRLIVLTEVAAFVSLAFIVLGRPAAVIAMLFLDLVSVAPMFNPANSRDMYYPVTPAIRSMQSDGVYRIAGIGRALQPMTSTLFGLEDIRVHDPLAFAPYVAMLEEAGLDRSTYFEQFRAMPPRPLLDFLGVRYVIAPSGFTDTVLPVHYKGPDATVFRNDTAMPRYFIPEDVAGGAVSLVEYASNRSVIMVRAAQRTFIASSEVALPGWKLTRNGRRWPLQRINRGTFVGWSVPPGESRFVLRYEPPGLRAGFVAATAGAIALLLMFIASRRHSGRSASASDN